MPEIPTEPVQVHPEYVRTKAGRIHIVLMANGHRHPREECNLDDAPGAETPVTLAELEAADQSALCGHCFAHWRGAAGGEA